MSINDILVDFDKTPQKQKEFGVLVTSRGNFRRKSLENALLDVPDEQILHINNKDLLPSNS